MMLSATLRRAADSTAASGLRSGCSLGWEDSHEGVSPNTHTQDKRKEDSRLRVRYDITMVTMGSRRSRGAAPGGRESEGPCTPPMDGAGQHGWRPPLSASEVALLEKATLPRSPILLLAPAAAAPQPREGSFIIANEGAGNDAGYYYSISNGAAPRCNPERSDHDDYRTRETPERRENPPTLSLTDGTHAKGSGAHALHLSSLQGGYTTRHIPALKAGCISDQEL